MDKRTSGSRPSGQMSFHKLTVLSSEDVASSWTLIPKNQIPIPTPILEDLQPGLHGSLVSRSWTVEQSSA